MTDKSSTGLWKSVPISEKLDFYDPVVRKKELIHLKCYQRQYENNIQFSNYIADCTVEYFQRNWRISKPFN